MEERCMYVKEAVLNQLEREKRELKWQLARTAKIAEDRAADVVACESKVKDLMTIVEINKSVADKAVKRTYVQESCLRRLALERDEFQRRLLNQRKRFMEQTLRGLQRRINRRLKRDTLQALGTEVVRNRKTRLRVGRLPDLLYQARLAAAFQRWKRSQRTVSFHPDLLQHRTSTVYASTANTPVANGNDAFPTEYLYDECFRLRFKRRLELKRVSFFAWKAEWGLTKKKEKIATHYFQAQLWRRVLRVWRYRVQMKRQHQAILQSALHHRFFLVFRAWSIVSHRAANRKKLLVQILRKHRRKLLQHFLTRLRLKCVERCALEWTNVLKSAHLALEEEKMMYSLHQDAVMKEIHASYALQEQSKHRFLGFQSRKLAQMKHQELLRRFFVAWKWQIIRVRLHDRVAAQFHRVYHRTRLRRRHFVAWMRLAASQSRSRNCIADSQLRRQKALVEGLFRAFSAHVRCEFAKRRRLRAVISRFKRVYLQKSWSLWRQTILVDEQQVTAKYETRALVAKMEATQLKWQSEFARSEKLRNRVQLQCALLMNDANRGRFLRRFFKQWARDSKAARLKRKALGRVLMKQITRNLRLNFARWRRQALRLAAVSQQLETRVTRHTRQCLHSTLTRWHKFVSQQSLLRWNTQRKCLYFTLWRGFQSRKKERAVAFCRFLKRKITFDWQFQALSKWKRWHVMACKSEQRRESKTQELLERVWKKWNCYVKHKLRLRNHQHVKIQMRMAGAQQRIAKRMVFGSWKLLYQRDQHHNLVFSLAFAKRTTAHPKLQGLLSKWHHFTRFSMQRRKALARILLRHLVMKNLRIKWVCWVNFTVYTSAHLVLGSRTLTRLDSVVGMVTSRYTVEKAFKSWRHSTREVRSFRQKHARFMDSCRRNSLRQHFVLWRRDFRNHNAALRRVLQRRVGHIHRMALKLAFQQWGRCAKHQALDLQSTVSQILLDRSQERAEGLTDLLLATKSLRVYFSVLLRFARSRKARRQALRRALRIRIQQLERFAWMQWTSVNRCHKKFRQLYSVVEKMALRTVWQTLRRNHRLYSQQAHATHTISKIFRRSWLRFEWSSWKRRDHLVVYEQVKVSQQNSLKLVRAVMEGLAHRRHARSSQSYCFLRWRQHVAKKKRIRQFWSHLTGNREHLSIRASFQCWARFTDLSIERRTLLKRVFTRQLKTAIWCAFHHWKYEGIIAIHKLQLASAQQELHSHRVENAKHVAMVMYMAWKRPCLSSCFSNWRMCIQDQKREFETRVTQQISKRTTGTMSKVLNSWHGFARMKRTVDVLWKTFVSENGRKQVSNCFFKWKSDFVSKQKLVFTISRLVETLRLWHLRQGFKCLQVSHQAIQRCKSMMIVLSAQNALKQQKRQHLVKSVAFLLHKRQSKSLRELFAHWRSVHETKKQLNLFSNATRRRFQLKMLHRVLSKWRVVIKRRRSTAKMVLKLQNAWSKRKLRKRWTDWCAFMEYSHCIKWLVYNRMFENRVHLEVQSAWRKWKSVVKQANLEIEQARITSWTQASERQLCEIETLENRNESLLLESVGLRMQINELRERNLILFCFKLAAVVATSTAGSRHKVARAFAKWRHRTQSVSVLVGLLTGLRTQWAASGFHKWCSITTELRISAELEKKQTYAMEKVLLVFNCSSAQQRKCKVLLLWRAMADRQRAKKKNEMLLLLAKRSSDRVVIRCCWASWKTLLMRKRDTQIKVCAMQTRAKQRLVQQIYLKWCRWHMTARDIRNGLLLLARVMRGSQRKQVAHCWLRWRSQRMDAVVTIAHAKLAILELEHWNAVCQHNLDQLMALVFANWKRFVRVAQARCWERVVAYRELQSRQLVRKCFDGWRNQLLARRRVLHPVLCIQTSLRKVPKVATSAAAKSAALAHQHEQRLFYCSYNEYRRNLQCSWRLRRTKSALHKRVLRICALSILLQSVRRQHLAAQKRAFWIWFAKCQCISPALGSIQFKSVPWRIPRTNFAGSMLLLALEEMHHLQQAFSIEQRVQSLKTLAVIVKGFRRQHLQRAFNRLKVQRVAFTPLTKRYKRERAVMTVAHLHKAERAAAAQAFAGKLVCFLVRRSFRVWKEQYIEAALVQAEAVQMELLHALRDVSSYRQTLDPYAVPY